MNVISFLCHMGLSEIWIRYTDCLEIAHMVRWLSLLWYSYASSRLITKQWTA